MVEKTVEPKEITNLGWATTSLSHADTKNQIWVAGVTGEEHTPAISRPLWVEIKFHPMPGLQCEWLKPLIFM